MFFGVQQGQPANAPGIAAAVEAAARGASVQARQGAHTLVDWTMASS